MTLRTDRGPGLSAKQRQVVAFAGTKRRAIVCVGATRAGKSFACALSHALWMHRWGAGSMHLVAGLSVTNAWLNAGQHLVDALRALGVVVDGRASTGVMTAHLPGGPGHIRVVGASDTRARERIQGYTLASCHIDELSLVHRDFWPWAWSRLSVPGAKLWATTNPEGPAHWVKRKVVDTLESRNGVLVDMRMKDNPSMTAEVRAQIESGLEGHWYERLVEGRWVARRASSTRAGRRRRTRGRTPARRGRWGSTGAVRR